MVEFNAINNNKYRQKLDGTLSYACRVDFVNNMSAEQILFLKFVGILKLGKNCEF